MELGRWDELELVRRCKGGSEAAFAELVRRYRQRLLTLAYRLTGDAATAEDVVQETFVAAFRAIDRFEPRPSIGAWLNTIAIRLAARASAKSDAAPRVHLDLMTDDDMGQAVANAFGAVAGHDPHAAAEAAELRRELAAAIHALPFRYRAAVVTRYVLGLGYAEAAASLEMGLNTYKSHLLRGTHQLREALAESTGRAEGRGEGRTDERSQAGLRGSPSTGARVATASRAEAYRPAARVGRTVSAPRARLRDGMATEKPLRS